VSHHLLLLSIGPVQHFIAQARKLHDLRSGSQLLSELTKAAILTFDKAGGEVIVPGDVNSDSLPNRILGSVSDRSTEEVIALAKALEQSVGAYWQGEVNEVLKKLPDQNKDDQWHQRFAEQTDQLLEIYWAVEPYEDKADYPRAYHAIENRLGAVKNIRPFEQIGSTFEGDETSRKDALTGERDALVFGYSQNEKFPATTDHQLPLRLNNRGPLVGPNEGLSAVSVVKRLRHLLDREFASTADTALLGLRHALAESGSFSLDDYYEELRLSKKDGDGQLAYAENLTESYFNNQGLKLEDLLHFRKAHERLRRSIKKQELHQSSYYAILAFDGDNMGAWLSGRKLPAEQRTKKLRSFHSDIGKYLAKFARKARQIVDDSQQGLTVYAGGDDYLGLLTLDGLFGVPQSLRKAFKDDVSDPLREAYRIEEEFTFSAGVVIAHYKRPLGDTVQLALAAEKTAKQSGRDAFCMRVVKRSGEQQEATFGWKLDTNAQSASLATIWQLTGMLQGRFGRTWLTESARTVRQLYGSGPVNDYGRDLLKTELARLLLRTIDSGGGASRGKKESAVRHLDQLIELTAYGKTAARNLVFALQLIDFLKREMNTLHTAAATEA
jgi:CRISPR-associated protein Cmr2